MVICCIGILALKGVTGKFKMKYYSEEVVSKVTLL